MSLRQHACAILLLGFASCAIIPSDMNTGFSNYILNFETPTDPGLQRQVEQIDHQIRARFEIPSENVAVGLLDLKRLRLAMIHPDRSEYAASLPKIGILLAWFETHPDAANEFDPETRHQLGLMVKASSNSAAARFSQELGLKRIQSVLNAHGLYDRAHGGGLWVGKHYGRSEERYGDPVQDHSHAATVRQTLRFFLWLEQRKLVSPDASQRMREIFESPEISHDQIKFVLGLHRRERQIIRKWGSWEDWQHDAAVVTGPDRHYILVGLTRHPRGDDYLVELARAADDLMNSVP